MVNVLTQRAMKLTVLSLVRQRRRLLKGKLPKPTIAYFGYGANLNPKRFEKYEMNAEPIGVACLNDYALRFSLPCEYLGKGYGSVEPTPGSTVWGYLYRLDRFSLFLLDIMEWAVLNQYHRVLVKVQTSDGKQVEAYTYKARYPKEGLCPSEVYKKSILEAGRSHGFPESYLNEIAAQECRDKFELDPGFSLMFPSRRRPLEKILRAPYLLHDKAREWIADRLRF